MNSKFRLILLIVSFPFIAFANGDGGKKTKKGGEDQYDKYEREEVAFYRDRKEFVKPDPKPVVVAPQNEVEDVSVKLSHHFASGNKVYIAADPRLDRMIEIDRKEKYGTDVADGFRIQVYAGASRQGALSRKSQVKQSELVQESGVIDYIDYRAPNYVVRVGDFLEKEDALMFCRKLRREFPGAFVAPARVNVPKYNPDMDSNR
ncbi:MAG: SPOR domain-containing protein [Bacteroidota bacterium]